MLFNVNPDLFIGSLELNRLIKFLDDDGFRKLLLQDSLSFGIVNNSKAGAFDNFRVTAGTNPGTIKIADGLAIDNAGQLITYLATDNIVLTNDSQWYWLTIAHQYDTREVGLCSVDGVGNLTLPSGGLAKVLRGTPNNPVTVTFPGASLNTQEYEVSEVTSDTVAVLAGDFQAESNLRLAVVGAFTPGIAVPGGSKYPYNYDSCELTVTLGDSPPALTEGEEFTIARVKRTGSSVFIEDKRLSIYRTKADYQLNTISTDLLTTPNPVIGVTKVKFNHLNTPRDENLVYVEWAFISSNWTFDSATNKVTFNGGKGGRFKDTTYFTNGDFDGWRLYGHGGNNAGQLYGIIRQSTKTGSQINLIIDQLDVNNLADGAQALYVTPDCDMIDIGIRPATASNNNLTSKKLTFPINVQAMSDGDGSITMEVIIPLVAYQNAAQYILWYQYDHHRQYGIETVFPADSVGYYPESAYDAVGHYVSGAQVPYTTNPTVTLALAPNAYSQRIASVETGDLFGVEYLPLSNSSPVADFVAGTRKQRVVVTNDDDLDQSDADFGGTFTFTVDQVLNFKTNLPATLKNGNSFWVQFRGPYAPGAFSLRLVQDYVNPGNPGIVLYTLTAADYASASTDGLLLLVTYDGTRWFVKRFVNAEAQFDAIEFVIDGGGTAITTGQKGHYEVPFDCTVVGWTIFADASGSIVVDIWKDVYANFPPTGADTIAGSEKPTLSSAVKNQDLTLTTWTTALVKGDIIAFNVDSAATVKRVTVCLRVTR